MARIELNIVALGDFTSINNQIKALQAQAEVLNKSLVGVGLGSALTKDLAAANAEFKSTMLSTGQWTSQTVKLTAETDKFGQALVSGKLKLTEYFSIIKNQSSAATNSMRALALEQTKLQNSIVMQDPTKRGVASVYTPTVIDEIANKTKIAANMQNLYNIAVDKGSQSLINWGKNTQWAGRQLTVGLTLPMTIFGKTAMTTFQQVNDELVRLQKVYGTGLQQPTQVVLDNIKKQVVGLSRELASSMGIAAKDTAAMAADLAATGKTGNDLIVATREAMRLSKLGELDTQQAMQATVSLQNVYKLSTQQLSGAVDFLNAVENQTSTSLQDLVDGIPRVGPIVQQLGGSFKDTAVMMVAMKEAGVPAAQSANAIKSALASLINPTRAAKDAFAAYNINLANIATSTKGNPVQMIMQLQTALKGLAPLAQAQLIEKLFGKFQEARIQALITNLGAVNSQTKTAFDLVNASAPQLAAVAAQEMKIATESTTGRFKRAAETLKADLIPIGEKIMEVATVLLKMGDQISKVFSGIPGPIKAIMGFMLGASVLVGPIVMLVGLMANFAGYVLKTAMNFKQLITGTKTFGELFTPEMIASQNAAALFETKILSDAGAIDVLNAAVSKLVLNLEAMSMAMNAGTGSGVTSTIANVAGINIGDLKRDAKLSSSPRVIQTQTAEKTWDTLEQEQLAAREAALKVNPNLSEAQLRNLTNKQASHMTPDFNTINVGEKSINVKNWKAENLMTDLGGINNYFDRNKKVFDNFEKNHLESAAKKLGMSVDQVTSELNAMRSGIAPATRQSAAVLRQVALTDPNYQGQGIAAALKVRLKGNFYDTIQNRSYDTTKNVIAEKQTAKGVLKLRSLISQKGASSAVGSQIASNTAIVAEEAAVEGAVLAEKAAPQVVSKIGSKLGSIMKSGAGKGIVGIGVSMAANALLPNNGVGGVAKAAIGDAATGAMIGSFIPGVGTAIGAAVGGAFGLIHSGLNELISAEKRHQENVASTFAVSTDAMTIFGTSINAAATATHHFNDQQANIPGLSIKATSELQKEVDAISKLSKESSLKKAADQIKGLTGKEQVVGTTVQLGLSQVMAGEDPKKVAEMIRAVMTYAGQTQYLTAALLEFNNATKDGTTTTQSYVAKIEQAMLKSDLMSRIVKGENLSFDKLNKTQQNAATGLETMFNIMADGKTSFTTLDKQLDALKHSTLDNLTATTLLEAAFNKNDPETGKLFKKLIGMNGNYITSLKIAIALQNGLMDNEKVKTATGELVPANSDAGLKALGSDPKQLDAFTKKAKAQQATLMKALGLDNAASNSGGGTTGISKAYDKILAAEKARIDGLEKTNKLMTDQNQLAQDAVNFATQQTDIQGQIRQAMGSGDYLKANLLRQQLSGNADTYAQKVAENANTQAIDKGRQLYTDARAKIDAGEKLSAAEVKALSSYSPSLQKYQVGSATVPSAMTIGSASQLGTTNNTNSPTVNVVINGSTLSADQLESSVRSAVANALKQDSIKYGMNGKKTKVGK